VEGVDGKKRKLNVPAKQRAEIRAHHPEENPASLIHKLRF
jgi:hypothetical protein